MNEKNYKKLCAVIGHLSNIKDGTIPLPKQGTSNNVKFDKAISESLNLISEVILDSKLE